MKRAYLIELTVLRDYLKQILLVGLFVSAMIVIGMGSTVSVCAIFTMMAFMMGTMSCAAYDEANNWGMFRLTMPLSRRDVVLGRYAVIVTMGLGGAVIGLVATLVLGAVAPVLPLPADLQAGMVLSLENVMASVFAAALCLAFGSLIASVGTPLYFRFGQTKATQLVPLFSVVAFLLVFMAVDQLDAGAIASALQNALRFIETPQGVAVSVAVAVLFAAAVMAVSVFASCKLYERREL